MTAILKYITDFLGSIWDAIQAIFSFLMSVIRGLISLFGMLPKFITYVTSSIGYMPSMLAVFATATLAIAIVYLVIGRDTSD
ncbi:MAG: hypothetical protein NC122_00630 [Faecalibacterium sp.]|nr:hypothetical protein [Ruminococcus sp.]MCM1484693.1 hypothetical protein [Faecalibacterium sp.]